MTEDCNKTQKTKKKEKEAEGKKKQKAKRNSRCFLCQNCWTSTPSQFLVCFFEKKNEKTNIPHYFRFVRSFGKSRNRITNILCRRLCHEKKNNRFVFCSFFARVGLVSKFYEIL